MAATLRRLRSVLSGSGVQAGEGGGDRGGDLVPELGFKATLCEHSGELRVTVIGARHLPTVFGLTRAQGYVVKVKLFPGKDKFETKMQKESWPMFNQDFIFQIGSNSKRIEDILSGKFVVFTVYAILELSSEDPKNQRHSSQSFMNFFSRGGNEMRRSESVRSSQRVSLYKRRTVGAVTYNLDARCFTQRPKNNLLATLDAWRNIKSLASGFTDKDKQKENNKGSVELTMTYSTSEDGKNDMIKLTLSKLRFSIHTMETHENYTGSLYVKMKIFEHDVMVGKWRSNKFEPTISHKVDPGSGTVSGTLNACNLHASKCEIRLMCRNKLGKKVQLGQVVLSPGVQHFDLSIQSPSEPITTWHNFT